MSELPLAGLRVVELASFVSGPFAGTLLADFGADVVKIELPGKGDMQRGLGTFLPEDDERSLWWMAVARNKRSLTLDLRRPEAKPVLERLVRDADVVTENFRPGTLERWGIGWDWIHHVNPRATMLRISGYGQTGPNRERPSFERVAQAYSGFMYVTGDPSTPPQKSGLPICDYTSGLWGAFGILLALLHQLRSGDEEGQYIDHAIYESIIPLMKEIPAVYDRLDLVEERVGNRSANVAPGEAYRTRDGVWLFIAVTGDTIFRRAMVAIGRQDLADDPAMATNTGRLANRDVLDGALADWVVRHDRDDVLKAMSEAEVSISPVNSIADLFADPHVQAREDFVEIDDARLGKMRMQGTFPKLSNTPGSIRRSAPRIGEHTDEILVDELGFTAHEVAQLRSGGVIG